MNDATHDVKSVFFEALEKESSEELNDYLNEVCGDSAKLRSRVEDLLQAHQKAGEFLGGPSPTRAHCDQPAPRSAPSSSMRCISTVPAPLNACSASTPIRSPCTQPA